MMQPRPQSPSPNSIYIYDGAMLSTETMTVPTYVLSVVIARFLSLSQLPMKYSHLFVEK